MPPEDDDGSSQELQQGRSASRFREPPHGPLHGFRVLDVTAMASGPFATSILGDQGPDVIKVEPPGSGDLIRHIGTSSGGVSAIFATMNRSKHSIVLDLKAERGIESYCCSWQTTPTCWCRTSGRARPSAWGSGPSW